MKFILSILLPLILLSMAGQKYLFDTEANPLTLFDFDSVDSPTWQVVNDGVMGGRSKGYVSIEEGSLRFKGELVTRGGGFTSIRANKEVDLTLFDGIELRVRSTGRVFELEVDDGTRRGWRSVSRRASFDTKGIWTNVRIPFNSLGTTVFGRRVSAPAIDLSSIEQFGLYMADGIDGPFDLEVDWIKAYKRDS